MEQLTVDWQKLILEEIENPAMKRKQIAHTYRILLEKEFKTADWGKINRAIIERWSKSALLWIKQTAWSGKGLPVTTPGAQED